MAVGVAGGGQFQGVDEVFLSVRPEHPDGQLAAREDDRFL